MHLRNRSLCSPRRGEDRIYNSYVNGHNVPDSNPQINLGLSENIISEVGEPHSWSPDNYSTSAGRPGFSSTNTGEITNTTWTSQICMPSCNTSSTGNSSSGPMMSGVSIFSPARTSVPPQSIGVTAPGEPNMSQTTRSEDGRNRRPEREPNRWINQQSHVPPLLYSEGMRRPSLQEQRYLQHQRVENVPREQYGSTVFWSQNTDCSRDQFYDQPTYDHQSNYAFGGNSASQGHQNFNVSNCERQYGDRYNGGLQILHYDRPRDLLQYPATGNIRMTGNCEPHTRPPMYSGTSEWNSFYLAFQIVARRYNWSDQHQAEELILCLRDEALSYAARLPPYVQMDITSLCREMDKRFGDHTLPETYRRNLQNHRKNENENYSQYASRTTEQVRKAYPGINIDLFNNLCVEYLLNGIPDQNIAYDVITKRPQNIDEAINLLTWHHSCKSGFRPRNIVRQVSSESDNDAEDRSRTKHSYLESKKFVTEERLEQFGKQLTNTITESVTKTIDQKLSRYFTSNKKSAETDVKPGINRKVICFACKEEGHFARSCPFRKNDGMYRESQRGPERQPEMNNAVENNHLN